MTHKRLSIVLVYLSISLIYLAGCKKNEQPQIDVVRNFIDALGSFDCAGLEAADDPYGSQEFTDLSEAYQNYTTYRGASEDAFTLMLCDVYFSDMVYEVVFRDDTCVVVEATGAWGQGAEESPFQQQFVVVQNEKGWVIDIDADSCE